MAQVSVRAGQACKGPVVGCTLAGADPTAVEVFQQVEQASGESIYLIPVCQALCWNRRSAAAVLS